MKRVTAVVLAVVLVLCALPALAEETWVPQMGAHPVVKDMLEGTTSADAAQGFTALAKRNGVEDTDALPGMKAQVGYTLVERSYPAAGMTAEEYWAMIKDGYVLEGVNLAYNLNEVGGGLKIWLGARGSSTVQHAVWAGNRIFSIAVTEERANLSMAVTSPMCTVTGYDSDDNTVTSDLSGASSSESLNDWLKALKTEGEQMFGSIGFSATITINQLY